MTQTTDYYTKQKLEGHVFTMHNINAAFPYTAIHEHMCRSEPITPPAGPSYWSHLSGRYRTAREQKEFVAKGCVDKKRPPLNVEVRK